MCLWFAAQINLIAESVMSGTFNLFNMFFLLDEWSKSASLLLIGYSNLLTIAEILTFLIFLYFSQALEKL